MILYVGVDMEHIGCLQQAITWASVDPILWHHTIVLCHNQLSKILHFNSMVP